MSRYLRLTSDMVPIHMKKGEHSFTCPLPKGYKDAILIYSPEEIKESMRITLLMLNLMAKDEMGVLTNIMLEDPKTEVFIREIEFNKNGLIAICVGNLTHSGAVTLSYSQKNCDQCIEEISYLFEDGVSFQCNVNYYWQALLCREVAVEYFNLLQKKLN